MLEIKRKILAVFRPNGHVSPVFKRVYSVLPSRASYVERPLISMDIEKTLVPRNAKFVLIPDSKRYTIEQYFKRDGVMLLNSSGNYAVCEMVAKAIGSHPNLAISAHDGAYVTVPDMSKPLIDKRIPKELVDKVLKVVHELEPRAVIALSGLGSSYYLDRRNAGITLFELMELRKGRMRYRLNSNPKDFEDVSFKTYTMRFLPFNPKAEGGKSKDERKMAKKNAEKQIAMNVVAILTGNTKIAEERVAKEMEKYKDALEDIWGKFECQEDDLGINVVCKGCSKANALRAVADFYNESELRKAEHKRRVIKPENIFSVDDTAKGIGAKDVVEDERTNLMFVDLTLNAKRSRLKKETQKKNKLIKNLKGMVVDPYNNRKRIEYEGIKRAYFDQEEQKMQNEFMPLLNEEKEQQLKLIDEDTALTEEQKQAKRDELEKRVNIVIEQKRRDIDAGKPAPAPELEAEDLFVKSAMSAISRVDNIMEKKRLLKERELFPGRTITSYEVGDQIPEDELPAPVN